MFRKIGLILSILVLSLLVAVPAWADSGKPDFKPHIFADGKAWGTKVTTVLPASNGKNDQSFDKLYAFTNGVNGQLPVSEAGPGNPAYNGGRWETWTATWTISDPPVVMSYEEIMHHVNAGDLVVSQGPPPGGPPPYFSCPLLPVK